MKSLEGAGAGRTSLHRGSDADITPLRKRRLSGELYVRDAKVQALLAELAILPRDALIERAQIPGVMTCVTS